MSAADAARGREADRPSQIPARGWWDIVRRVLADLGRHNISLVSAGLALYALLAVFPALTALTLLYGMFGSPDQLMAQLQQFSRTVPPGVWQLLQAQLHAVASQQHGTLGMAAVLSLAVAVWSARSGMSSLMSAVNIAYREQEKRSLVMQIALSLLFTACALLAFIVMLVLTVAVPLVLKFAGLSALMKILATAIRWLLLWCFAVFGLALIYRYCPSREQPRWRWLSVGSVTGAVLWLAGSFLFSIYVQTVANYQRSYGPLASEVALMMWFLLSSFAVVLGAEINSETERQTRRDTTTGPQQPMGQRGAFAADTLGHGRGR